VPGGGLSLRCTTSNAAYSYQHYRGLTGGCRPPVMTPCSCILKPTLSYPSTVLSLPRSYIQPCLNTDCGGLRSRNERHQTVRSDFALQ